MRDVFREIDHIASDSADDEKDYQQNPLGMITSRLDKNIKRFQKDNNQREDGYIFPKGEIEDKLRYILSARKQDEESTEQSSATDALPLQEIEEKPAPIPAKKPTFIKDEQFEKIIPMLKISEVPIEYLYRDHLGNVTAGSGRMLPNIEAAKNLPFYIFENNEPKRRATKKEIKYNFDKVKNSEKSLNTVANACDPKNSKGELLDMRLRDEDMDEMLKLDIRKHELELLLGFPDLDVANLPDAAQQVMLDMMFNMGRTKFNSKKWPAFAAAIKAKDWKKAAEESNRKHIPLERNQETKALLLSLMDNTKN